MASITLLLAAWSVGWALVAELVAQYPGTTFGAWGDAHLTSCPLPRTCAVVDTGGSRTTSWFWRRIARAWLLAQIVGMLKWIS